MPAFSQIRVAEPWTAIAVVASLVLVVLLAVGIVALIRRLPG